MTTRTTLSRRQFGAGVAALGAASTLPMPALAQSKTIKIGFVTPQTGPLAVFAESDAFVLEQFRTQLAGGLQINGETYNVEIGRASCRERV